MAYTYTRPRAPIAAMYSSPGPCYGLPGLVGQGFHDPRSVHLKGPAYWFGIRHGHFTDSSSPGPKYFPNSKIYRDGKDGQPHYSLTSRQKDLSTYRVPGPGTYSPEKYINQNFKRLPEYSFAQRLRSRSTDDIPAPNKYTLPKMLGSTVESNKKASPTYSIVGRSKIGGFHEDLQKTPGPGAYNETNARVYKVREPEYSITSRNILPGDPTTKPGPGAHSPEKVWSHKREPPHFSFGIRHSQYSAPLIVDVCD